MTHTLYETFDLAWKIMGVVLIGLTLTVPALSQGMCPIKTVKVESVRGNVVENSTLRTPWENISVELLSTGDDEQVISSIKTDERGGFRFGPLKKGTYALHFRHDLLATYRLIVKTQGTDPLKAGLKGSSILVMLGVNCFETKVLLGK